MPPRSPEETCYSGDILNITLDNLRVSFDPGHERNDIRALSHFISSHRYPTRNLHLTQDNPFLLGVSYGIRARHLDSLTIELLTETNSASSRRRTIYMDTPFFYGRSTPAKLTILNRSRHILNVDEKFIQEGLIHPVQMERLEIRGPVEIDSTAFSEAYIQALNLDPDVDGELHYLSFPRNGYPTEGSGFQYCSKRAYNERQRRDVCAETKVFPAIN